MMGLVGRGIDQDHAVNVDEKDGLGKEEVAKAGRGRRRVVLGDKHN